MSNMKKKLTQMLNNLQNEASQLKVVIDNTPDWEKVPVDTLILVKNYLGHEWIKAYFAEYKNDKVYVFPYGATSQTTTSSQKKISYTYATSVALPQVPAFPPAFSPAPVREETLEWIERTGDTMPDVLESKNVIVVLEQADETLEFKAGSAMNFDWRSGYPSSIKRYAVVNGGVA